MDSTLTTEPETAEQFTDRTGLVIMRRANKHSAPRGKAHIMRITGVGNDLVFSSRCGRYGLGDMVEGLVDVAPETCGACLHAERTTGQPMPTSTGRPKGTKNRPRS